jgi:hypothetical protein
MIPPGGAFSVRSLRGVKTFRASERIPHQALGFAPIGPSRRTAVTASPIRAVAKVTSASDFVRWATFRRALAAGGPISTGNHLDASPLSRDPEWIALTRAATGRHFRNRGERALRCSVRGTHACRLGRDRDFEAKLQRPQTLLRAGPAPKH